MGRLLRWWESKGSWDELEAEAKSVLGESIPVETVVVPIDVGLPFAWAEGYEDLEPVQGPPTPPHELLCKVGIEGGCGLCYIRANPPTCTTGAAPILTAWPPAVTGPGKAYTMPELVETGPEPTWC